MALLLVLAIERGDDGSQSLCAPPERPHKYAIASRSVQRVLGIDGTDVRYSRGAGRQVRPAGRVIP